MKLTMLRLFTGIASLVFFLGAVFVSCNNGNTTPEEEVVEESTLESSAFCILRTFCDLTQYDENASISGETTVCGIPTLPDNWQTLTFEATEGFVLDEENEPKVRYIPVENLSEAEAYIHNLFPDFLEGTTWKEEGLGSLEYTYAPDPDNSDFYATINVNIPIIENLSQIKLVPLEVIEEANATNGSRTPYYSAGDVIKRKSDNTVWMCVRPARESIWYGSSTYWICLDFGDHNSDEKLNKFFNSETKQYNDLYFEGSFKRNQTWTYAHNLMSKETAKAAAHTFNALLTHKNTNLNPIPGASVSYEKLTAESVNIDICSLLTTAKSQSINKDSPIDLISFCFAYDSPRTDWSRSSQNAKVTYVQPYILSYTERKEGRKNIEEISTCMMGGAINYSLFSVTDEYDYFFQKNNFEDVILPDYALNGYDFKNYLHKYNVQEGLSFKNYDYYCHYGKNAKPIHVIFSPELEISDRPLNERYEEILVQGDIERKLDYWESIKYQTLVNDPY